MGRVVLLTLALCVSGAAVAADCGPELAAERARLFRVFGDGVDVDAWLDQFAEADRPTALRLLGQAHFVSQSELRRHLRALHQNVLAQARADGVTELTYSRMYTAKSGDLISYYYRGTNLIPATRFVDADVLAARPPDGPTGRALVFVDDYVGTGAQFLTEYATRARAELFARYERVYVVVVAAHVRAIRRFAEVADGRAADVAEEFIAEFHAGELDATMAREGLKRADLHRPRLIYELKDEGFTLDPALDAFLNQYRAFERNPWAPYGVAGLLSKIGFFHTPPNGMPDLLWNSRGRLRPLFDRTEDISNYGFAQGLPDDEQVWGGPR